MALQTMDMRFDALTSRVSELERKIRVYQRLSELTGARLSRQDSEIEQLQSRTSALNDLLYDIPENILGPNAAFTPFRGTSHRMTPQRRKRMSGRSKRRRSSRRA